MVGVCHKQLIQHIYIRKLETTPLPSAHSSGHLAHPWVIALVKVDEPDPDSSQTPIGQPPVSQESIVRLVKVPKIGHSQGRLSRLNSGENRDLGKNGKTSGSGPQKGLDE